MSRAYNISFDNDAEFYPGYNLTSPTFRHMLVLGPGSRRSALKLPCVTSAYREILI